MSNYFYFNYSKDHPEELLDPYYAKSMVVIPNDSSQHNQLTTNNERLIELITAYGVLTSYGKTHEDNDIKKIVDEVIYIMDNTSNINFSAFSQFFMVYNSNYSIYIS